MKDKFVKSKFIRETLKEQGDRLLKNQGAVMYKRIQYHTGALKKNRSISVSLAGKPLSGKLSFTHTTKERFLDMKRQVNRKRGTGKRMKRGYNVHNRFVFGHYYSIANQLMHGFTEEVAQSIRTRFKSNTNG